MKLLDQHKNRRAMTLIDVLIVILTMALVVTFLVVGGLPRRARCRLRISCVNNLRQVGLAFRMWANDHGDKFPWNVPSKDGGTLEFSNSVQVWRHFDIASNELNSPRVLSCPLDTGRIRTNVWPIANQKISYFIGLDADETKPNSILSGDRNLSTNNLILSGVVSFQSAGAVRWTSTIHTNEGDIGLADGSGQQVAGRALFQCITNAGLPLRLSIP